MRLPNPVAELRAFLRASLVQPVPSDAPPESRGAVLRRRWVAGVTGLGGAVLLAWTLALPPGDPAFEPATFAVAGVWALGALASGPLRLGRARTRAGGAPSRAVVQSLALGTLLLAIFLAGAALVAGVPALRDPVQHLLDHARYGSLALVAVATAVNGMAEELYFRGALFAALPRRFAVAGTAIAYTLTTVPTQIPLLVFAAAVLGTVVGLQRRVTGGVLGPVVTHLTWSLGMLFLLPYALDAWSRG
jgi:membrane protease YdiL (CAAX protease family)